MHFRAITRIVGLLVILFSGTMIIPGLVALIYRDGAGRAFTQTFFVALAIGSMLWWPNRKEKGERHCRYHPPRPATQPLESHRFVPERYSGAGF